MYKNDTLRLANDFEKDGQPRVNHFHIHRNTRLFYFQIYVTNGRSRVTGEQVKALHRMTDAEARELQSFLNHYLGER